MPKRASCCCERSARSVARPTRNPGMVFAALRQDASEHHEHAVVVADFLDEMRERMSLLIPERTPTRTTRPATTG